MQRVEFDSRSDASPSLQSEHALVPPVEYLPTTQNEEIPFKQNEPAGQGVWLAQPMKLLGVAQSVAVQPGRTEEGGRPSPGQNTELLGHSLAFSKESGWSQ